MVRNDCTDHEYLAFLARTKMVGQSKSDWTLPCLEACLDKLDWSDGVPEPLGKLVTDARSMGERFPQRTLPTLVAEHCGEVRLRSCLLYTSDAADE